LLDYAYLRNDYVTDERTSQSFEEELQSQNQDINDNFKKISALYPEMESKCGTQITEDIFKNMNVLSDGFTNQSKLLSNVAYESFQSGIFRYKLQKVFNPLRWFSK